MKTCDEMLKSVISKAKKDIAKRKQRMKTALSIGTAVLCLMLIVGLTLVHWNTAATPQPTEGQLNVIPTIQNMEPSQEEMIITMDNIFLLSATEKGESLVPMQPNVTLPVNSLFRVRSLKGMTESEREIAIEEERQFNEDFKVKYGDSDGGWYLMQVIPENIYRDGKLVTVDGAVIQYLSGGKASLILPNAEEIESFESETTGMLSTNGGYGIYNMDVTIGEGENAVTVPKGSYRIYLHLGIGDELFKAIKEHPDMPLSVIKDAITIKINFKNGTQGMVKVDVVVEDDGQVYMTMRGNSAV
jgi:hypothetical protein